ncbi:MAG: apolipoprotein N-acyltransferase [Acidobacteria bacterium]|nr:apolipoprotein N-acyltransferase [Acidobacteriota bacterium]
MNESLARFADCRTPVARAVFASIGGVLVALSFPKAAVGWLALIAPAFLMLAVVRAATRREAFLLGWLGFTVTWLVNMPWVTIVMSHYGGLSRGVGVLLYLALALLMGSFGAIFGVIVRSLDVDERSRFAWTLIPVAWTACEYLRDFLPFGGFPWHLLGGALVDAGPLPQVARWTGTYGLSFLAVAVATLLGRRWMLRDDRLTAARSGMMAVAVAVIWAAAGQLATPDEEKGDAGTLKVALLQPDIEQEMRWDAGRALEIFELMRSMTLEARGAELVVWPESSVPLVYFDEPFWQEFAESFSRETHADLIFGSVARDDSTRLYWNSAYLVSGGAVRGRYDKYRLVPFGEYVPGRKLLFFARKLVHAVGEFQQGVTIAPLEGRVPYGPAICYEIVFPSIPRASVREGAELIVTITNDAWFGDSAAPPQHLAMARMRAIETDRWIVRAATTGISAVIDPSGNVVRTIPLGERGIIETTVGLRRTKTPYVVVGDWPAWASIAALALFAAGRIRRGRG